MIKYQSEVPNNEIIHTVRQCYLHKCFFNYSCNLDQSLVTHLKEHYLVETKEAQVTDNAECTDPRPGGDFTCYLKANLYNLQRVGEDHLRSSGLNQSREELHDNKFDESFFKCALA